ncbi:MAG: sigma-54 dependent transcriptional regulator [Methylovulum sp.]|jgi:two-component system response regulator PilR (NtrC family)|nr:sigma-54 dependent transcriptional regulator [Methylovulum sp.]MCF7998659.1 sigma-54 dependent transcriptional regulator [Methylovulum sp.]
MTAPLVLIVDDEPDIRELLEITLNRMAIQTHCAENLTSAKVLLSQYTFDLCLTDMRLPDGNGLELVDEIQALPEPIPVAVITAHGNMDTAILAMKKGAFDFISKPMQLASFRQLIREALKLSSEHGIPSKTRRMDTVLLGESPSMQNIRANIAKLARSQAPVYISGESGSGKELVARLIHQQSARSEQAFVAINCGAIPHELMESEFFGHKKGSFSGAVSDKKGLIQAAEGGTLFLDEIADLPALLQVKLLRVIQEKQIRPVGDSKEIPVNFRLLSATHRNLADMVKEGSFRQDLYYRINVIDLHIPPLRERRSDIPLLVDYALEKLASANGLAKPKLSDAALTMLQHYHFPGNVRELENILERAIALYDGIKIDSADLHLGVETPGASPKYASNKGLLENYLHSIEKKAILLALEENQWNKNAAAKQLGISLRSLHYRLNKLQLAL